MPSFADLELQDLELKPYMDAQLLLDTLQAEDIDMWQGYNLFSDENLNTSSSLNHNKDQIKEENIDMDCLSSICPNDLLSHMDEINEQSKLNPHQHQHHQSQHLHQNHFMQHHHQLQQLQHQQQHHHHNQLQPSQHQMYHHQELHEQQHQQQQQQQPHSNHMVYQQHQFGVYKPGSIVDEIGSSLDFHTTNETNQHARSYNPANCCAEQVCCPTTTSNGMFQSSLEQPQSQKQLQQNGIIDTCDSAIMGGNGALYHVEHDMTSSSSPLSSSSSPLSSSSSSLSSSSSVSPPNSVDYNMLGVPHQQLMMLNHSQSSLVEQQQQQQVSSTPLVMSTNTVCKSNRLNESIQATGVKTKAKVNTVSTTNILPLSPPTSNGGGGSSDSESNHSMSCGTSPMINSTQAVVSSSSTLPRTAQTKIRKNAKLHKLNKESTKQQQVAKRNQLRASAAAASLLKQARHQPYSIKSSNSNASRLNALADHKHASSPLSYSSSSQAKQNITSTSMSSSDEDCWPFLCSLSKLPSSGPLLLTEEEKRTLVQEGHQVPYQLPLSKSEEKILKKIRRKIKNKISAQESRRKKKEYVDSLEKRMENYINENTELKKRLEDLELNNRGLLGQLQRMQMKMQHTNDDMTTDLAIPKFKHDYDYMSNNGYENGVSFDDSHYSLASTNQLGPLLIVLVLFFAVVIGVWTPVFTSDQDSSPHSNSKATSKLIKASAAAAASSSTSSSRHMTTVASVAATAVAAASVVVTSIKTEAKSPAPAVEDEESNVKQSTTTNGGRKIGAKKRKLMIASASSSEVTVAVSDSTSTDTSMNSSNSNSSSPNSSSSSNGQNVNSNGETSVKKSPVNVHCDDQPSLQASSSSSPTALSAASNTNNSISSSISNGISSISSTSVTLATTRSKTGTAVELTKVRPFIRKIPANMPKETTVTSVVTNDSDSDASTTSSSSALKPTTASTTSTASLLTSMNTNNLPITIQLGSSTAKTIPSLINLNSCCTNSSHNGSNFRVLNTNQINSSSPSSLSTLSTTSLPGSPASASNGIASANSNVNVNGNTNTTSGAKLPTRFRLINSNGVVVGTSAQTHHQSVIKLSSSF